MPVTFQYSSSKALSVDQLQDVSCWSRKCYLYEEPEERISLINLQPVKLPVLTSLLSAAEVSPIRIVGQLSTRKDPFQTFEYTLCRWMSLRKQFSSFTVKIGFAEKESQQSKRSHNRIDVNLIEGGLYLGFSDGGFRSLDKRAVYSKLIEASCLPVRIENKGKHFRLVHTLGGNLSVNGCIPPDLCPGFFRCELTEDTVPLALLRMRHVLDAISRPKRLSHSWSTTLDSKVIEHAYRVLQEDDFLAERYTLDFKIIFKNLNAVDHVRTLFSPKDTMLWHLGTLGIPSDDRWYVNLDVETTSQGHRLKAEASEPVNIQDLSSRLGIQIK